MRAGRREIKRMAVRVRCGIQRGAVISRPRGNRDAFDYVIAQCRSGGRRAAAGSPSASRISTLTQADNLDRLRTFIRPPFIIQAQRLIVDVNRIELASADFQSRRCPVFVQDEKIYLVARGDEMPDDIQIRCLQTIGDRDIQGLSDVLIDCVEGGVFGQLYVPDDPCQGGGVLAWRGREPGGGERIVLAAEDATGTILGTVQVIRESARKPAAPRGSRQDARAAQRPPAGGGRCAACRGRARAFGAGKTLPGARHGQRRRRTNVRGQGWQRCGVIPAYALMPDGAPCAHHDFLQVSGI